MVVYRFSFEGFEPIRHVNMLKLISVLHLIQLSSLQGEPCFHVFTIGHYSDSFKLFQSYFINCCSKAVTCLAYSF